MSQGTTAVMREAVVAGPVTASSSCERQEEDDCGVRKSPVLESAPASDSELAEGEQHAEPPHSLPEFEPSSCVQADSPPAVAAHPVGDAAPTWGSSSQTPSLADVKEEEAGQAASAASSESQLSAGQRARGGGEPGHTAGRSSASRKKSAAKRPGIR